MALIEKELDIISVAKLLSMKLVIPSYQRAYRWSIKSTNTLFMDAYDSFKSGIMEYRLGTVIMHKENGQYNIVDGQQRATTLSILLFNLGRSEQNLSLLNEKYNDSSTNSIVDNQKIITKRIRELPENELMSFKSYLENNCTIVKIVTNSEQEAFQFFDSQNSRGKSLKPHDLLKSYHLREMEAETVKTKLDIIANWENTDQNDLEDLFRNYLYPSIQWHKRRNGLNYSTNKIHSFKGIKQNNTLNYALYHKASNIFIEQINSSGSSELFNSTYLNQFQLTQPIIGGKRFFQWTLHYAELLEKIRFRINSFHDKILIPNKRSGDIYIKQLYESAVLFFVDRFGFDAVDDATMYQIYTWSYSLRLKMRAVYLTSVNKYSIGMHERINYGIDLFNLISEMSEPKEIKGILLDRVDPSEVDKTSSYYPIYEVLKEWNGW